MRTPIFFGWSTPWLPRLANYLLHEWNEGASCSREDLSRSVVVLPGGRAGRRLLELLALQAEKEKISFIPPRILTLREAVRVLFIPPKKLLPEAHEWTCRLAWSEAFKGLPRSLFEKIQPLATQDTPTSTRENLTRIFHADRDEEAAKADGGRRAMKSDDGCMSTYCPRKTLSSTQHPSGFPVSTVDRCEISGLIPIIEALADELGSVGIDFKNLAASMGELSPESAEREEPRWEALACLQQNYRELLASWGYSDPIDFLRSSLVSGVAETELRVLVAGVVESRVIFKSFFEKVDPTLIIIAPKEHAAGFSKEGMLVTPYWLEHPALIQDTQLIPCERSEDQAKEVLRLVSLMKEQPSLVSVAVPDVNTLPMLRDGLESEGIFTRWAGGLPFRGGRLHRLLQAIAHFLNHEVHCGPSIQEVRTLVQHPDIYPHCREPEDFLKQLDRIEREHLPPFLEKKSLVYFKKNQKLISSLEELEGLIGKHSTPYTLGNGIRELRSLLLRIVGKRKIRTDTSLGHYFLGSLELCLEIFDEIEASSSALSFTCTMSHLIEKALELLVEKKIPEREEPRAVELLGWLEIAADDAPCTILTSCHEGSWPASHTSNAFLPEGLKKRLGIADERSILARDHYLLQSIVASREAILIAPRYNGKGEPTRPSRLLTLGLPLEELPKRVLSLTQRNVKAKEKISLSISQDPSKLDPPPLEGKGKSPSSEMQNATTHQALEDPIPTSGAMTLESIQQLGVVELSKKSPITTVTVTGLRTYLQSPRLFYLQHVLKLQEVKDASQEMDAGHFGTLIHEVLGDYALEGSTLHARNLSDIMAWLSQRLLNIASHHFAPGPTLPIKMQLEEALATLEGFAKAEVDHYAEGWRIMAAENKRMSSRGPLEKKMILSPGRSLLLQGRIDRIDWHEKEERWMIIDYKTHHDQDWKRGTPNRKHFQKKGDEILWKDLQLPLYLQLAPCSEHLQQLGLPLPTPDNTDLCYFQLPIEPQKARLSEPFDHKMIIPAWHEATRLMEAIIDGYFEPLGDITPNGMPTLAALSGLSS